MAAGNKTPKITDFDTLEAYVNADFGCGRTS